MPSPPPPPAWHRSCCRNACLTLVSECQTISLRAVLRLDSSKGTEKKGRASQPALRPLPHKVGTGPWPPAALVHALDHCLRAVLHLAGHRPCHRVMAPVPVGRTTVTSALTVSEVPTVGQKSPPQARGPILLGKRHTEKLCSGLRGRKNTTPYGYQTLASSASSNAPCGISEKAVPCLPPGKQRK